jgi:hypothetical protein
VFEVHRNTAWIAFDDRDLGQLLATRQIKGHDLLATKVCNVNMTMAADADAVWLYRLSCASAKVAE